MIKWAVLALLPLMLFSCSSNKSGESSENSKGQTEAVQPKTMDEATSVYVNKFASYGFRTRRDAVDKYMNLCSACEDAPRDEKDLPPTVWSKINTIIPSLPDAQRIQEDLIGQELEEGKEDGYFDGKRWLVERGQIRDFTILEEQKSSKRYEAKIKMKLYKTSSYGFDVILKVAYELRDKELDWNLDYVLSQGMDIIKTGNYDGMVVVSSDCSYFLINKCSSPLLVGYTLVESDGDTKKSFCVMKGYEKSYVETHGTVVIDFIEKNY